MLYNELVQIDLDLIEQNKIRNKADYIDRWAYRVLNGVKKRAKKLGMPMELHPSDITIPTHCPILGIELVIGGKGRLRENSPSIDRIDNNKGYTKNNVQVISYRANRLKSNATAQELLTIGNYLVNLGSNPIC